MGAWAFSCLLRGPCQNKSETTVLKCHVEKFYLLFCFAFFTFLGCKKKKGIKSDNMIYIYPVQSPCTVITFMQMLVHSISSQHYINLHDMFTICWIIKGGKTRYMLTDQHFSAAQQLSSCLVLNPSSFPQHNDPWGRKKMRENN